jgi:two-component system, cell cycle sensor histidine kinase and response regulator CckA
MPATPSSSTPSPIPVPSPSNTAFSSLVREFDDPVIITDAHWRVLWCNRAAEATAGSLAAPGSDLLVLFDAVTRERLLLDGERAVAAGHLWRGAGTLDTGAALVDVTVIPVTSDDGRAWRGIRLSHTDIVRHLERRAREADRLEGIARLTAALSHEFNDLLTAITGAAEVLCAELPAINPLHADADAIQRAADRAAVLARQLTRASASRAAVPSLVDVGRAVSAMAPMLGRELGDTVEFHLDTGTGAHAAHIDVAQLELALQHIARNARHAMPGGGTVRLSLHAATIDEARPVVHALLRPGRYLVLGVRDSGLGMDDATRARAFEPLYSSSGGTGLGLNLVFGIATQMGGYIACESAPGHGTTLTLYIPEAASEDAALRAPVAPMVLLVDDEDVVRRVAARALRRDGYRVIEAASGEEALEALARHPAAFDLLLTDVVMPGMNGVELAQLALDVHPRLRVLYSSGAIIASGHGTPRIPAGAAFLPKPFTPRALGARVRDLLAR